MPVSFAIFAKFAAFTKPFLSFSLCKSRILKNLLFLLFSPYLLLNLLTYSKKNSSYFCDFCDICYFFSIFLIAVFFKSFFAKIAKQFASNFLLTRSILDISEGGGGWEVYRYTVILLEKSWLKYPKLPWYTQDSSENDGFHDQAQKKKFLEKTRS